jgi:hypothetical protein
MSKVAAFFGDLLFCAGNPMLAHMVFLGGLCILSPTNENL